MTRRQLIWISGDQLTKAVFSLENVGQLTVELRSKSFSSESIGLSHGERRQVALQHAKLLVHGFAAELERESGSDA